VGHGDVVCALDKEWGAAAAAVDGGQGWRRESGDRLSSGRRVAVEKESLRTLSRSESSCWACLKAQRGTTRASWSWQRQRGARLLGWRRRNVGRSRGGQREAGKAAGKAGRARGSVQCGAEVAGALHMAGQSGGGTSSRQQRRKREGRRRGTEMEIAKNTRTPM
jgi:hypothetical protein